MMLSDTVLATATGDVHDGIRERNALRSRARMQPTDDTGSS